MSERATIKRKSELREVLDSDTLSALEEGIRSEQTGRIFTWEEAKTFARERRQKWMKVPTRLSA